MLFMFRKINVRSLVQLAAVIGTLAVSGAGAQSQEQFEGLRFKFEVEKENFHKPIVTLREQYDARLLELQERFTTAGDFRKAIAAKAAADADGLDSEGVDESVKEVAVVQKVYLKERDSRIEKEQLGLKVLYQSYGEQLSQLRTKLTKSNRLEEAAKVDAELKKIAEEAKKIAAVTASAELPKIGSNPKSKFIPEEAKEWQGNYYLLYDEKASWDEAVSRCRRIKGHLVTISSEEEDAFVEKIAQKKDCWIGLSNDRLDGKWRWVTREPVKYVGWMDGRPDNATGNEQCAFLYQGRLWEDGARGAKRRYVCEWEVEDSVLQPRIRR